MSDPYDSLKKIGKFLSSIQQRINPTLPKTTNYVGQNQTFSSDTTSSTSRPASSSKMLNTREFPILAESDRSCKEKCIKYYIELREMIQKQIEMYGIIPTIPDKMLESLKANYCEEADAEILDRFVVRPIFDMLDEHFHYMDCNVPVWKTLLLQKMILDQIILSPEYMKETYYKEENNLQHVFEINQTYLQNPTFMSQFLDGGEPKNGNYTKSFHIYLSILNMSDKAKSGTETNNIFHRLALAVALEFAKPIHIFDTKHEIDPIARYHLYEKAFIDGELDPCFHTLTTWDLRMVVNNDASDDEISWCRRMLRNYRPDHILDVGNYRWKYCMIVKSDISYKVPDWKTFPKTYKQLISGGGKCGPRAWFGRYVCKSFGIPTWGVRQPGHAAMSHYVPLQESNEWVICLGGPNWKKSHWEGRKGTHFNWESVARRRFPKKFECIQWMSCFARIAGETCAENENPIGLKDLWTQLKWLKMRQLASNDNDVTTHGMNNDQAVWTLIEQVENTYVDKQDIKYLSNVISVPASCHLDTPRGILLAMKSFHKDGGDQVHLRQNATLKYDISPPKEVESRKNHSFKYNLICRIVTVHADTSPLLLRISTRLGMFSGSIKIPYSAGEWTRTEPIEISLLEGENNELCFSQSIEGADGITIKDFILTRIS